MKDSCSSSAIVVHGSRRLAAVTIDGYNAELRAGKGFIGDRASTGAFREILEKGRERLREVGDDPLGTKPTEDLSKKKLDKTLMEGDPEAAGVIHGAIEEFAAELAKVTARFLRLKAWRRIKRVVVGGGLRGSRTGELAIGRASVLIKDAGHDVRLEPIHHHPDEAGLVGAAHLVPGWMFTGHDAILALDIGGSNLRAGIVALRLAKAPDFSLSAVHESELWRYADEDTKPSREDLVLRIGQMLNHCVRQAAKDDLTLAPFVGVGCPGVISQDGSIQRGGQNLPGNWESSRFNLPAQIREQLPTIGDHETTVVMHNDAVIQGLSEIPFIRAVKHWGVLTIGTGLGNAAFTNIGDSP
jgi:predicted NBD/HSP70 family sugar kinase